MSHKDRMKRIEKVVNPAENILKPILPDWLQDSNYVEPEDNGRTIVPSGYLALQPNGMVKFKT